MRHRRTDDQVQTLREKVRERAREQGGVFRRSDLIAWGIDPGAIVSMKRNGSWKRLHHGVYVDSDDLQRSSDPLSMQSLMSAAALAAIPGDAALFGPSAAVAHDLPLDRALLDRVHLVRPPGSDSRAIRRRVTSQDHLPPPVIHILDATEHDVVIVNGLPSVSREIGACGTAMLSDDDWAVASLDAVCWQDESARGRLQEISLRWPNLAGAGRLKRALLDVRSGAQTPLESLSRVKLVRCGLKEPHLQVPLSDGDGLIGVVDMLFDDLGVVGEADGELKYANPDDVRREKWREDRIRALGFGVVRWGWRDVMGSMKPVARRVQEASVHSRRRRAS